MPVSASLFTLAASAGETSPDQLKLLGAIVLLVVIALFTTSRATLRMRRSRAMILLLSGGWLAVGVGVALGPGGLGLIVGERFQVTLTPAIQAALGWIGLMLGLQARAEVLRELPRWVWRVVGLDSLLVGVVFGLGAVFGMRAFLGTWDIGGVWWGAAVLVCAASAWAVETRSLTGVDAQKKYELARMGIAAGGTLSAIVWVLVFGLLLAIAPRGATGVVEVDILGGVTTLLGGAAGAVVIAFVGRYALTLAGKAPEKRLAVFLGMVTLSAGFAGQLGIPALTVSLMTGIALAHLGAAGVREFERFILKADMVIATLLALLTGVLLSSSIGFADIALACGLAALRLLLKPVVLAVGTPSGTARGPLSIAPVRQGPAALAIGLSALLLEPSELMARVLGIVVLTGVLSALLPAVLSYTGQHVDTSDDEGVGAS